jgi:hypothetical protein
MILMYLQFYIIFTFYYERKEADQRESEERRLESIRLVLLEVIDLKKVYIPALSRRASSLSSASAVDLHGRRRLCCEVIMISAVVNINLKYCAYLLQCAQSFAKPLLRRLRLLSRPFQVLLRRLQLALGLPQRGLTPSQLEPELPHLLAGPLV